MENVKSAFKRIYFCSVQIFNYFHIFKFEGIQKKNKM